MILRRLKYLTSEIGMYRQSYRKLHLTKECKMNPNNVTEVRIPVPWGHIAGKWWGSTNEQPILALHGWQDNASSFDPLLELLPDSQPVLAIDIPGHGFSSHFPEGMLYHNTNHAMVCRRIQKYFDWGDKITFFGHSLGGIVAFVFSSIYPELVKGIVTLDVVKPFGPEQSYLSNLGRIIDLCNSKSRRELIENPKYSLQEIEQRWLNGSGGSLTSDAVRVLMKRGVQLHNESGKYFFTRDPKVKIDWPFRFDENQSIEMALSLKCHYLAIRFSDGKLFDNSLKNSPRFVSTVTKSAKSFQIVNIEGPHHTHLTHPDRVVPVIDKFLQNINI